MDSPYARAPGVEPDGAGGVIWNRPPSFPMWLFPPAIGNLPETPPGHSRLLALVNHSAYFPGSSWLDALGGFDKFVAACGPNDIVWVPLYICGIDRRVSWPAALQQKLPAYDEHIALIKVLAPRVAGIITGNMGPELCHWHPGLGMSKMLSEFAKYHAEIIHNAGGTPVFGTVDWDVLYDCYQQGGLLHRTMQEIGAIQVVFCGFTICQGCEFDPTHPLFKGQQSAINEAERGWPHRALEQYISSANMISGVSGMTGFNAGNDIRLRELGFKGGLMGAPGPE